MKFYFLRLSMLMTLMISQAQAATTGFERCADSSFALPTLDLSQHRAADCKDISGHWKGTEIGDWPMAQKRVVDIQFNAKSETYAVCDQMFSCRGRNTDENAPPENWYWFTAQGPAGSSVGGQVVCQGRFIDLLYHDQNNLYYRFHFEALPNGTLKYSICGQRPFLLKKM